MIKRTLPTIEELKEEIEVIDLSDRWEEIVRDTLYRGMLTNPHAVLSGFYEIKLPTPLPKTTKNDILITIKTELEYMGYSVSVNFASPSLSITVKNEDLTDDEE